MSTDLAPSAHGYASPPMTTLILTVLFLLFFFIGFFSVFFCRFFIHTAHFRHSESQLEPSNKPPHTGLDPTILNSFPTFTYSTVKDLRIEKFGLECAICISEFIGDDTLRLFPKCCHVFHRECIDLWIDSNKTCPVCRSDLEIVEQQQNTAMLNINEDEPLEDSVRIDTPSVEDQRQEARVERMEISDKFSRSHSTGHSIKKRDDLGVDKFTLRLPEKAHARLLRGHNWTGSCTVFGDFTSKNETSHGRFGEISDFACGDVNRV